MEPSDLELYTTRELVNELVRRKTFLGVVVHSEDEFKSKEWTGERMFKVHYNSNLNTEQVCCILDAVADYMDRRKSS